MYQVPAVTTSIIYIIFYLLVHLKKSFVKPAAWPPPSPLVVLLTLRVQRSQPALATSPARSLPDGPAVTDTNAREGERDYQLKSKFAGTKKEDNR